MAPGARSKYGAPMFEHMSFGSKCTALKKVVILVELFGARGIAPLSLLVMPVWATCFEFFGIETERSNSIPRLKVKLRSEGSVRTDLVFKCVVDEASVILEICRRLLC